MNAIAALGQRVIERVRGIGVATQVSVIYELSNSFV